MPWSQRGTLALARIGKWKGKTCTHQESEARTNACKAQPYTQRRPHTNTDVSPSKWLKLEFPREAKCLCLSPSPPGRARLTGSALTQPCRSREEKPNIHRRSLSRKSSHRNEHSVHIVSVQTWMPLTLLHFKKEHMTHALYSKSSEVQR